MGQLANIDANVEGLTRQHRQGIRMYRSLVGHSATLLFSSAQKNECGLEKPGTVGVPLPRSDKKSARFKLL
jgi:hypothetical protein